MAATNCAGWDAVVRSSPAARPPAAQSRNAPLCIYRPWAREALPTERRPWATGQCRRSAYQWQHGCASKQRRLCIQSVCSVMSMRIQWWLAVLTDICEPRVPRADAVHTRGVVPDAPQQVDDQCLQWLRGTQQTTPDHRRPPVLHCMSVKGVQGMHVKSPDTRSHLCSVMRFQEASVLAACLQLSKP
jgi:hypothetical protein